MTVERLSGQGLQPAYGFGYPTTTIVSLEAPVKYPISLTLAGRVISFVGGSNMGFCTSGKPLVPPLFPAEEPTYARTVRTETLAA